MAYAFADKGLEVLKKSVKIVFREFHNKVSKMSGN